MLARSGQLGCITFGPWRRWTGRPRAGQLGACGALVSCAHIPAAPHVVAAAAAWGLRQTLLKRHLCPDARPFHPSLALRAASGRGESAGYPHRWAACEHACGRTLTAAMPRRCVHHRPRADVVEVRWAEGGVAQELSMAACAMLQPRP
jgi:hypothetical protein